MAWCEILRDSSQTIARRRSTIRVELEEVRGTDDDVVGIVLDEVTGIAVNVAMGQSLSLRTVEWLRNRCEV
jgi:hypothetical protein